AVWLREEVERRAGEDASRWPRLLEPAEEWFLWRQCAAEVARPFALLNAGALAESLQRSSELAAQFRIPLGAQGEGSESDILCRAQRAFDERCRDFRATSLAALLERLADRGTAGRGTAGRGPLDPRSLARGDRRGTAPRAAADNRASPRDARVPRGRRVGFRGLQSLAARALLGPARRATAGAARRAAPRAPHGEAAPAGLPRCARSRAGGSSADRAGAQRTAHRRRRNARRGKRLAAPVVGALRRRALGGRVARAARRRRRRTADTAPLARAPR